jgi:hypothetical protein
MQRNHTVLNGIKQAAMEQTMELIQQPYPWWAVIGALLGWAVTLVAGMVFQYQLRKAEETIRVQQAHYKITLDLHAERYKEWRDRLDTARNEHNANYEGRIKHLTERLSKATDDNRALALHYSARMGGSTEDVMKATKLYYRFLQGKEGA